MEVACTIGHNFRPCYFNKETGNTLYWEALCDAYAYSPASDFKRYPINGSKVCKGDWIAYDDIKYGYSEHDFKLVERVN